MILAAWVLGLGLEAAIGEPRRWHPLVGFGRLAHALEQRFNHADLRILKGAVSWLILVAGVVILALLLKRGLGTWAWLIDGLALWGALGARSLAQHVQAVITPLQQGDLATARYDLSMIVSRDCAALDEVGIACATIETTLENGADAIFCSLFWFVLGSFYGFGAECVLLHRSSNTLDAMWGYKTERFLQFGRVAARADDLLNAIPARLTALSYAVIGQTRAALRCWHQQASLHDSPNAGVVMAAGAGALGIKVGGAAVYHGQLTIRPLFGCGRPPVLSDMTRALHLVAHTLIFWLLVTSGILLCQALR